jgi:hypothetical protein
MLWIDIVLMPIRIRIHISMFMPIYIRIQIRIHTRIRICIKTVPILMRILPQVLHMLETRNSQLPMISQCQLCNNFSIFSTILKFLEKIYFINFFICYELIPIQIRQIITDPTRSGSESGSKTPFFLSSFFFVSFLQLRFTSSSLKHISLVLSYYQSLTALLRHLLLLHMQIYL